MDVLVPATAGSEPQAGRSRASPEWRERRAPPRSPPPEAPSPSKPRASGAPHLPPVAPPAERAVRVDESPDPPAPVASPERAGASRCATGYPGSRLRAATFPPRRGASPSKVCLWDLSGYSVAVVACT